MFEMNKDYYPKLYLLYVDDILAVFEDNNSCATFFNLLSSQHQNTKFIVERSSTAIPFLDVEITLNDPG